MRFSNPVAVAAFFCYIFVVVKCRIIIQIWLRMRGNWTQLEEDALFRDCAGLPTELVAAMRAGPQFCG
jgi:hypothetical protein